MWLASFRLAEVVALDHPLNPLRRELRLHGLCEEIVLDPFSEEEVAEYVAQRSPSIARDEAFVRALHERTDGVPLFVASVMSEMSARAAQGGGGVPPEQVASMAVPENLAAIIDHYIARLETEQRTVFSAAAVCGVEFRVGTVAGALGRDVAWVGDICDELAREQFWLVAPRAEEGAMTAESPYSFRHALFRQVLYERATPSARAQLHRKMGAALERERTARVPVAAAELATHFERGGEPMTALRYYAEAAEARSCHFSPAECMRIVERASSLLEQAPAGPERNALEITIATLHGVAATRVLGVGSEAKQRARARVRAARRSSAASDARPPAARLRFHADARAEYAEALAVADRAQALGSGTDDPVLLSTACIVHGEVDQLQGDRGRPAHGSSAGSRLPSGWTWGLENFWSIRRSRCSVCSPFRCFILARSSRRAHRVQRAYVRARDRGWPMARLAALWYSALFEVRLGDAERVAALADEMHALVEEFTLALGRTAMSVVSRLGRRPNGRSRATVIDESATRTKRTRVLECSPVQVKSSGMRPRRLSLPATSKERRRAPPSAAVADKLGERVYLPQL